MPHRDAWSKGIGPLGFKAHLVLKKGLQTFSTPRPVTPKPKRKTPSRKPKPQAYDHDKERLMKDRGLRVSRDIEPCYKPTTWIRNVKP